MRTMDDRELLEAYATNRSEAAFAELVQRHLAWVYSVALRHVGDASLAEEIAQSVFVLLARKAASLRSGTLLGGWLFRTTRFVANRALRAEKRRRSREQTAASMIPSLSENNEALWERLSPHLDEAVATLSEIDRAAVLLRFYEKKPLLEVGRRLGLSEEAAKKRVSRAVDKLRTFLSQRGVTLGAAALVGLLGQKTVQAAPLTLASAVLKTAAASASVSATLPELARETLEAWRWAQVKLVAGLATASLALIFVAGTAAGWFTKQTPSQTGPVQAALPADVSAAAARAADDSSAHAINALAKGQDKTGEVTGLVLDDQGRPVLGASVWNGPSKIPFARDTTDASGRFGLDKAGVPEFVTVTADGFAADQREFNAANTAQLVFRLSPVPSLNLRLVDESGEPVAGVRLFLSTWWGRPGTLAQYLAQETDAEGRLRWQSPPKSEFVIELVKSGYRFSRTNRMVADGNEHTVVLHPVAMVSGTVTDAESGAAVPSFQLTAGHSQPWNPSEPLPLWDRQSRPCTNGYYQMVIDEEQTPFLRLEAEGYETLETQIQITNAAEQFLNLQLRRLSADNSIRGTVLLPDGRPANGIEVALCTAQAGVMLNGTAFEPGAFGNIPQSRQAGYRTKTDAQGRFSFAPKPAAHTVVAVGPAGLGQARCFDFSTPREIRLQAWSRVTGTVRTRDGQWAGRTVQWSPLGNLTYWMTLFYAPKSFSATSDAAGRFTLDLVPPGDGRVAVLDDSGAAPILSPSIHVAPGETVDVQVGGTGRQVTGRLVAPPGVEVRNWTNQVTTAQLHVEWADYEIPKHLTGTAVERWKLEFEDTEAGRAWFRSQYSYDFKVAADGSFTIPEVLPGNYRLFISVAQGYLGSGPDSSPSSPGDHRVASTGMRVIVPEADTASPLDLGDIILVAD